MVRMTRMAFSKAPGRHDVPRPEVPLPQVHDLGTRLKGHLFQNRVHSRDRSVSGKGHADGFRKDLHGVSRAHHSASASAGTAQFFHLPVPALRRSSAFQVRKGRGGIPRPQVPLPLSDRKHRSTADQNGGQIQPGGRHEMRGSHFVADRQEDEGVKLIGLGYCFDVSDGDVSPGHV